MIDERFGYITDAQGRRFQVLIFDEHGNPIEWDEAATYAAYNQAQ
jgi:hypothetical protein